MAARGSGCTFFDRIDVHTEMWIGKRRHARWTRHPLQFLICLGCMGAKHKETYPTMATNSHPPGQTGETVKIVSRKCPRCPESERPHAAKLLHSGSVRLTCKTCGYYTFISAENSPKPPEAWLTQIDAGSRLGQNGHVGGGQVVLPADRRRGVK